MTGSAIAFFLFGATVLWGGLAVTLTIAIKGNK
ncbi:MAG: MetS family NSS transporter small subunit [Firmicutes bacterium]|nr:MetS family NSS transporter small subunit [Bacillota bacterium]